MQEKDLEQVEGQQLPVENKVESLIRVIRGQQVMLDRDLAELYGVLTKYLNKQVKRNAERFPGDFMFQLTKEECSRFQIGTLNEGRGSNIKYLPYAFTEQGVAMLSGILKSPTAIEVNIQIMRAFVSMRHFMVNNAAIFQRLETIEFNQLESNKVQAKIHSQYPPIEISVFRRSHDRFLCIDDTVYHIGASIKDLGKKWFAFSKMEDFKPEELVARINEVS